MITLRLMHKTPKINKNYPQSESINKWKLSRDQRKKRLIDGCVRENCLHPFFSDDLKKVIYYIYNTELSIYLDLEESVKFIITYTNEQLKNDHSYNHLGMFFRCYLYL